jgi:hypothetical protein
MNEMLNKLRIESDSEKLCWEAPKLISLDKSKTEGGSSITAPSEDFAYTRSAS